MRTKYAQSAEKTLADIQYESHKAITFDWITWLAAYDAHILY